MTGGGGGRGVHDRGCFSIFGYKEYNQSDFGIDDLVMSMWSDFSCVVGRECLL